MLRNIIYTLFLVLGYVIVPVITAVIVVYGSFFELTGCHGGYGKLNSFLILLWYIGASTLIAGSGFMLGVVVFKSIEQHWVGIVSGVVFSCLTIAGYFIAIQHHKIWYFFIGLWFISSLVFPISVTKFLQLMANKKIQRTV